MNTQQCTEKDIFGISWGGALSDLSVIKLLTEASQLLGEVKNISSGIFEHDFIVSTLKNIESLDSAKIEGTTGNLEDLYKKDDLDFERKKQLKLFSAINYRSTIDDVESIAQEYDTMSLALIRHIHKLLTQNDPSTGGTPGLFRRNDVKIANSRLGDFYPPSHLFIEELMKKYVQKINGLSELPTLLQIAIAHVQFESIHPFEDGNGRTGRLIINMNFLQNDMLKAAVLNLSDFFEKKRPDYISKLRSVTEEKSYKEWIKFFLKGVIYQCKNARQLIDQLKAIRNKNISLIEKEGKHALSVDILDYALNELFITTTDTAKALKKKHKQFKAIDQMTRNEIKRFVGLGILKKTDRRRGRADIYIHNGLASLLFRHNK
jgi:Fic family protein